MHNLYLWDAIRYLEKKQFYKPKITWIKAHLTKDKGNNYVDIMKEKNIQLKQINKQPEHLPNPNRSYKIY
jgi:uncharacterized protein YifN (PemK superfamily)